MLILGAISGIQDYVFDVAADGGGQARRLRARSFFVQLLSECATLRVRHVGSWHADVVAFCAAGRFLLTPPTVNEDTRRQIEVERDRIDRWLLESTGWQLRFSLIVDSGEGDVEMQYRRTTRALRRESSRPGSHTAIRNGRWVTDQLVLPPISPPCTVCGHRLGEHPERDEEAGETRLVCGRCFDDVRLGRAVVDHALLVVRSAVGPKDRDVLDLGVSFLDQPPKNEEAIWGVSALRTGGELELDLARSFPGKAFPRPLLSHIPHDAAGQLVEFTELAEQAMGDALLGVLKMDVDSLGAAVDRALQGARDFAPLSRLSNELDAFFSKVLSEEQRLEEWRSIYTVFAGGDDLLLVGPWNVIIDYSLHVERLFRRHFSGLSISAGVAFIKPRFSVRHAVNQAEELLGQAKTLPGTRADSPKGQCALLGQLFKWSDLAEVVKIGLLWTEWVQSNVAQRGWLHEWLEVAELREKSAMQIGNAPVAHAAEAGLAAARMAYQVQRKYPRGGAADPRARALRQWADTRLSDLDLPKTLDTLALPAIMRYALIATRARERRISDERPTP